MTSHKKTIRVGVVDDHPLFSLGIRAVLERRPGIEIVGEGASFREALEILSRGVDLITLDLNLADASGLSLIEQIHARAPQVKILVVSMLDEALYAERCVRCGASGFLAKGQAPRRLVDAVDRVLAGEVYFGDAVLRGLALRVAGGGAVADPISTLSTRELEVFQLMGKGHRPAAIAEMLHLSPKTVETHQAKLRRKLGAESSFQLLKMAILWFQDRHPESAAAM
ncbi:MAG: response regulator transcription factor [Alphaproteobacteria bacterium]|nr:response regulator transcription factor [Alphaproteobacteria bacterium]MCB9695084.1 response regulator transcription factor [Alphaproteobacteria bacterium]